MSHCNLANALMFDDPERVDEARSVCKRHCADLIECRAWALHTDVAGVCGGFTEQERASWREAFDIALPAPLVLLPRDKPRRPAPQVTADRRQSVRIMHSRGFTQRQIASALGVTQAAVWHLLQDRRTADSDDASHVAATPISMADFRDVEVAGE